MTATSTTDLEGVIPKRSEESPYAKLRNSQKSFSERHLKLIEDMFGEASTRSPNSVSLYCQVAFAKYDLSGLLAGLG